MEKDFELGGRNFQIRKIDPFKQFHIVRRIGPILKDLLPVLGDLKSLADLSLPESEQLAGIAKFMSPLMDGLSKLSDWDAEVVLNGLLQAVEMQQPSGHWAKVCTGTPPVLMVQDLELPALLTLAGKAFMFNLSGFFAALARK